MAETAEILYARSLLEAAQEAGCLKEVHMGADTVARLLADNPEYVRLLSSPAVPRQEKIDSISAVFDGRVAPYLANFLKVLVNNNRIAAFQGILKAFDEMASRAEGILAAEAVTAVALTPQLREKLCHKLERITGKKIRLSERIDPSVLGGVLLRYDGREIDGTVRKRLAALKKQLDAASAD